MGDFEAVMPGMSIKMEAEDETGTINDVSQPGSGFPRCPICDSRLQGKGERYPLEELLSLWAPVGFSRETEDELRCQSNFTRLYVCDGCGLEIFFPQIIGTPEFYDALQENSQGPYYVDDKWEFREALRAASGFDTIIEVGCGPGHFLGKISPHVRRAFGVEYNERAIQIARERGYSVFETDRDVLAAAGPVDAVFAFHVLEHVADPVGFLQRILALTRPGGKIILSVPNMDGPVRFVTPCVSNMPPHHASRWRASTIQSLARRLGLQVDRISYEPLIARFAYYYTLHWAKGVSRGNPFIFRVVSHFTERFFDFYFQVLAWFGRESLGFFRAQSLYVVMTKGNF
ncbi:MAG: class I SAM-dependent methyltransferase [Desulfobacteria bacterium]